MSENIDDNIELASSKQVNSYQRRTDSGKVITVRGYVRTSNDAVAQVARSLPGRPTVAANSGSFGGGRSLPVFPDAGKLARKDAVQEEKVEYEGIEETGVVDQEVLDKEVPVALEIMKNLPKNPALTELMNILSQNSSVSLSVIADRPFDPNIMELARGIVKVTGYSYVSKKTGKVVRVNPYTQMRSLISALGGPQMAAKKGITPDLIDAALPGYQMREKVFKPKSARLNSSKRTGGKVSTKDALRQINNLQVDREFDVPSPKPGDTYMTKAMSPQNPLEAVRNAKEGSQVTLGNNSWVRSLDGNWYKTPRRNGRPLTDRDITKAIASKGGRVELVQGDPIKRQEYPQSKVDYDRLDPNSKNYGASMRYAKALEPTFQNLPEGIADSLNDGLVVKRPGTRKESSIAHMTATKMSKADGYLPRLTVNPDSAMEAEVIKALPKHQSQGYVVPTVLHPLETIMARESSIYTEALILSRAPSEIRERLYDRLNAAYDKNVKKDKGDYSGLSGSAGWVARMTGDRTEELRKELKDGMSLSSLDSPSDFLAEAWTEYVGHPSPRPLSRDLGAAYQKGMEEFSDYLFNNKWADASEIPEKTWQKTTTKTTSRRVSDAIGGDSDHTQETNLAPRDLRSVLNHYAKYVDIRDEQGNPTFDASVEREGSRAHITNLTYPTSSPEDMPTGVPQNIETVNFEDSARYYETPMEMLKKGPTNQKKYSDYIDDRKALLAMEAVEETLFSEGVRRFEANARAGEDSLLYAKAGYQWDPDNTDVQEVSSLLEDLTEMMGRVSKDAKEGYYVVPQNQQRSVKSKVSRWQKNLTHDPATWPSPQEIAQLGKDSKVEKSLGEWALDARSWNGVKELNGKKYDKIIPEFIPDAPDDYSYQPSKPSSSGNTPSASSIGQVARAISLSSNTAESQVDVDLRDAMTQLGEEVLRKSAMYQDGKVKVTGGLDDHTIRLSSKDGKNNLFTMRVYKDPTTGDFVWDGPKYKKDDLGSAYLSFLAVDVLESAYQQSDLKKVWKNPKKDDPVASYVLASTGWTWENPPSRKQMETFFENEVGVQVAWIREALEEDMYKRASQGSGIADMVSAQATIDSKVEMYERSLSSEIGAYLDKFSQDDRGPHPFELTLLGKKQAYEARRDSHNPQAGSSISRSSKQRISNIQDKLSIPLQAGASPEQVTAYNLEQARLQKELDRAIQQQGTFLQQMTSLDGDATHDSSIEFLGKNVLTGGVYAWYKSLDGYWDWATNIQNPSSRKASVGLLFMLLRLLPASFLRGGLLMGANTLTKKLKSPRPEDWPSPQEIKDVMQDLTQHIPDDQLKQLFGTSDPAAIQAKMGVGN